MSRATVSTVNVNPIRAATGSCVFASIITPTRPGSAFFTDYQITLPQYRLSAGF